MILLKRLVSPKRILMTKLLKILFLILLKICITNLICIFGIENQYHKENVGQNCPKNRIITSVEKCEDALRVLGLKPFNLNTNQVSRPAGCYWRSDGTGNFNHMINPFSTNKSAFGNRGGICSLAGKDC